MHRWENSIFSCRINRSIWAAQLYLDWTSYPRLQTPYSYLFRGLHHLKGPAQTLSLNAFWWVLPSGRIRWSALLDRLHALPALTNLISASETSDLSEISLPWPALDSLKGSCGVVGVVSCPPASTLPSAMTGSVKVSFLKPSRTWLVIQVITITSGHQ